MQLMPNGTLAVPGVALAPTAQDLRAMQEIKPDQLWEEGLHQARIVNAFGVRIVIRRDGVDSDEEINEGDFRKRFKFVTDH